MYDNIILGLYFGITHNIGSNMCYWLLMMLGKFVSRTTLQHVICTEFIDLDTEWRIDKSDEELDKRLDDTNFVDDIRADLYIDNMGESDESAHGDGSDTPNDESYGDMVT